MKDVQCYELFGGIALKIHTFSFFIFSLTSGELINLPLEFSLISTKYRQNLSSDSKNLYLLSYLDISELYNLSDITLVIIIIISVTFFLFYHIAIFFHHTAILYISVLDHLNCVFYR